MLILSVFGDVMFWVYTIVVFILALGVIICLHEAGHLFFAKKAGILCHEYSIGMGPLIKQWKKPGKETAISVRAIPIGGFVSMAGEDLNESLLKEEQEIKVNIVDGYVTDIITDNKLEADLFGKVVTYDLYGKDGNELFIDLDTGEEVKHLLVKRDAHYVFSKKEKVQIAPYDRCFESKKWFPRFMTILAGPLMNFVLAFFIFLIVGMATGVANAESTKLGEVDTIYPAANVLQAGDVIKAINGNETNTWYDISNIMATLNGVDEIEVTYERDGAISSAKINTIVRNYRLGITNYDDKNSKVLKAESGLEFYPLYDGKKCISKSIKKDEAATLLGVYDKNGNYVEINSWQALNDFLDTDENKEINSLKVRVKTADKEEDIVSELIKHSDLKLYIGIDYSSDVKAGITCSTRFSFFGGIKNAGILFVDSITMVFRALGGLFNPKSDVSINDLSSVVGIVPVVQKYLSTSFISFLSFVGLLSANIGLVNLLPIPALDGGRILFLCIEGVTRKKINKKVDNIVNNIFFILLLALSVYIIIHDVISFF